jgi:hypothetical protein
VGTAASTGRRPAGGRREVSGFEWLREQVGVRVRVSSGAGLTGFHCVGLRAAGSGRSVAPATASRRGVCARVAPPRGGKWLRPQPLPSRLCRAANGRAERAAVGVLAPPGRARVRAGQRPAPPPTRSSRPAAAAAGLRGAVGSQPVPRSRRCGRRPADMRPVS